MPVPAGSRSSRYVTASELADYAFCPRAHYYAHHPGGRAVADGALERERAGVRYHTGTTRSDRRWAETSPLPWLLVLLGGVLLVAVGLLGWIP